MTHIGGASARALRIRSDAIPAHLGQPALEPVRLSGREGLNHLFEYELLLKTPDALNLGASGAVDFDLDAFIGREISCLIELDGAGEFVAGALGASVDRVSAGRAHRGRPAHAWAEKHRRTGCDPQSAGCTPLTSPGLKWRKKPACPCHPSACLLVAISSLCTHEAPESL